MTVQSTILSAARQLIGEITQLAPGVALDPLTVVDRSNLLTLGEPSTVSPNGTCRLIKARDGWFAINLARPEDVELIPAWIGQTPGKDPYETIAQIATHHRAADLVGRGAELGLPTARIGRGDLLEAGCSPLWAKIPGGSEIARGRFFCLVGGTAVRGNPRPCWPLRCQSGSRHAARSRAPNRAGVR